MEHRFEHTGLPPDAAPCATGRVLIRVPGKDGAHPAWLHLERPETVIAVHRLEDILPALKEIERAAERGYLAAGFICYEAASAFDHAMVAHEPGSFPLLWFGLYRPVDPVIHPPSASGAFELTDWQPSVSMRDYQSAIDDIKKRIAAGETYQINYTFRLRSLFKGDALSLFIALCRSQQSAYGAFMDTGRHMICSTSPELFFRLDGESITCRPMKGTSARGLTWPEDEARARQLGNSRKDRAENLMIVDMIRNDLGRIAHTGTIHAPRLFEVERYDTLLQMTSTVTAETSAPSSEILRALFPCASITGAPKIRAMRIIRDLETCARGVYTGCIGLIGPGRKALFSVAIRTAHIDTATGQAEYGTGGGIVWDSDPLAEYQECETKARVLRVERPDFSLLETLLWKPEGGYALLDGHLDRLLDSARYFGFNAFPDVVRSELDRAARGFKAHDERVRLLLAEDGTVSVQSAPMPRTLTTKRLRVALARRPLSRFNRYLYHKTTHRTVYEEAAADFPEFDDVILWNEEGEITESTVANIVVQKGGDLITPPVSSGLLPGVLRAHLLAQGRIREGILRREDLAPSERVYLINSVRGWMEADVETVP